MGCERTRVVKVASNVFDRGDWRNGFMWQEVWEEMGRMKNCSKLEVAKNSLARVQLRGESMAFSLTFVGSVTELIVYGAGDAVLVSGAMP